MKLASPLSIDNDVQPAFLPAFNYTPEYDSDTNCYVSGWGALEESRLKEISFVKN